MDDKYLLDELRVLFVFDLNHMIREDHLDLRQETAVFSWQHSIWHESAVSHGFLHVWTHCFEYCHLLGRIWVIEVVRAKLRKNLQDVLDFPSAAQPRS